MNDRRYLLPSVLLAGALLGGACGDAGQGAPTAPTPSASARHVTITSASPTVATPSPPPGRKPPQAPVGNAVALSPAADRVLVADEDHEAVFVTPLAFDDLSTLRVVQMPGPPAQIVALDEFVLVTIRTLPTDASRAARDAIRGPAPSAGGVAAFETSPAVAEKEKKVKQAGPAGKLDPTVVRQSQGGLLVAFTPDAEKGLVEVGRVTLAPDAWGIAVDPTGTRAVVSSAFASEVAVVDVHDPKAMRVTATLRTAREPRGVVFARDGSAAFVSHLVGADVTEIAGFEGEPRASLVHLAAAPERGPAGRESAASLGYALALSADGRTLFAPRHALGAEGNESWWGAPTVDVMDVASRRSLQPVRTVAGASTIATGHPPAMTDPPEWGALEGQAPKPSLELVQPRAVVYRKRNDALLVLSEGSDVVTALDALAPSPALAVIDTFKLGNGYAPFGEYPEHGGAPTGIALSRDESVMYVFCRTTFDLARVDYETGDKTWLHLANDGLPVAAARGRALFTSAKPGILSGGLGCAACHPEGRDDGYVWREGHLDVSGGAGEGQRFVGQRANIKREFFSSQKGTSEPTLLYPRQTPMIAGRLRSNGPYGWHGDDKDMLVRLLRGSNLHRGGWEKGISPDVGQGVAMIHYLVEYGRAGLMPPPTLARDLTDQEKKGKELFEGAKTSCSTCHKPEREMTDRSVPPMRALPTLAGFDPEENTAFKTPSLWFIAGTAPYFHDGSAPTLDDLVKNNGSRMGTTGGLTSDERDALVAYLRTL